MEKLINVAEQSSKELDFLVIDPAFVLKGLKVCSYSMQEELFECNFVVCKALFYCYCSFIISNYLISLSN